MKAFMDARFLLHSDTAFQLYHDHAQEMPIFDYHNHLSAREIYERTRYENIAQVWLGGDHYKWRAMRAAGIDEAFITGDASDYEKFTKWAGTVEKLPGNPLYHWTHLELQRYFDVYEPLTLSSAPDIWAACNEHLLEDGFDAYGLLKRMKVKALCTTDEPFDTLEWHLKIAEDAGIELKVLPTFRPDRLLHAEDAGFKNAISFMEARFGVAISSLDDLKDALRRAIAHFKRAGCLLADHGFIRFAYARGGDADAVMKKALDGGALNAEEIAVYKGELLRFLAAEYVENGMAMQLHLGALRNNNTPMYKKLGPNTGCDSVGEMTDPMQLSALLDDLVTAGTLPSTVLYCLNPNDNIMLATMAVNYACGEMPGKVQFGSAWWFQDHLRGIENQLDELLETGLLPSFIGMLTDSRSFTSFSRHEYFRRILCNKLGTIVENGEYPNDLTLLGGMVRDICYHNAVRYFGL